MASNYKTSMLRGSAKEVCVICRLQAVNKRSNNNDNNNMHLYPTTGHNLRRGWNI